MPGPSAQQSYVLKFISGKYQGGEFPLPVEKEVVAGRASDLDLVLAEDMVSRKHAKFTVAGDQVALQDLGSTNGTFVNGERVRKVQLKEGDRILIGTSILRLERAAAAAAGAEGQARQKLQEIGARKAETTEEKTSGRLEEIPLPDLMQMLTTAKKSGALVIKADEEGKIFFRNGQIYYACINENHSLGPFKSIYRIITWTRGYYEFTQPDPRRFMVELDDDLDVVLMEALRIRDELKKLMPKLPSLNRHVMLSMPMAVPFRDLTPEQLDILQMVYNYGQMKMVLDKSPLTDLDTLKAVGYLLSKGYIREG